MTKDINMFTVGKNIKSRRLTIGMTQSELAKAIKGTQSMISIYEEGYRDIKLRTLMRIANALGVDAGELLEEEENI